jgi:hypothetical protein
MRRPLRFTLVVLNRAGVAVDRIREGRRYTEIHTADGKRIRPHRGNRVSKHFERGVRSRIRRIQEMEERHD